MKRSKNARLGIDRLEDRAVPAVLASVVDGTLMIRGATSDPAAAIRVERQDGPVHVFDGATEIGVFANVRNLNVSPDATAHVVISMRNSASFDGLRIAMAGGSNSVQMKGGSITSATIVGGSGSDRIDINGLAAKQLTVDTAASSDQLTINTSTIGALRVFSSESVQLNSGTFGDVHLVNHTGSSRYSSSATIARDLYVGQAGGFLNVGGKVLGDLTYLQRRAVTGANLNLTGYVVGDLNMIGTQFGDNVTLAAGSQVDGNVDTKLLGENDQMTLAGAIGQDSTPTTLVADLGAGNDRLTLADTAKILAQKAAIFMGSGNDGCIIGKQAYFAWLNVDGGDGLDRLDAPRGLDQMTVTNVESVT